MAGDQNILHGRQLKQEEKKTEGTQEYRSPPVSKPGVMHASVSCSWPGLCWLQLSSEEPIGGGGESSLIIIINKGIRAGTSDESSCQSRCHRASASRRPRRPPLPASRSIRGEETTEAEGPGACKRWRQTWRPIDVRVYGLRNWCAGRPLEQMNNGGAGRGAGGCASGRRPGRRLNTRGGRAAGGDGRSGRWGLRGDRGEV